MKDLNVIVEDHRVCMLAVIVNRQRLKALVSSTFLGLKQTFDRTAGVCAHVSIGSWRCLHRDF